MLIKYIKHGDLSEDFPGVYISFLLPFCSKNVLNILRSYDDRLFKYTEKKIKNNSPEMESATEHVFSNRSIRFMAMQAEKVLKAVKCNNPSRQLCFCSQSTGIKNIVEAHLSSFPRLILF